jgi:hypothetical protein
LPSALYPTADSGLVKTLAAYVGQSYGAAYSIYLVSVFVPVMILFKWKEDALVAEAGPAPSFNLSKSPWSTLGKQLGQVATLLAPYISGGLLSTFTSMFAS